MRTLLRLATLAVFGALALAGVSLDSTADAQARPICSDGAGNVWDQVRGSIIDELIPDWIDHPWGPEAPGDLWKRCADPFLGPPGGRGSPGSNWGDPHITTQDGAKFDFHGAGDFILLRSESIDVEIQGRYVRGDSVTFFDGVAVRSGDTTVSVEDTPAGALTLFVDGQQLDLGDLGWSEFVGGTINQFGDTVVVQFDSGLAVRASGSHLDLVTPASWAGDFEGIQGNGDGDPANDLATSDGTIVDATDPDVLYGAYLDSWLVAPANSLFSVEFDPADGPTRPNEVVTIADLPDDDVKQASELCDEAGFVRGNGFEECVFDVAYTGDPVWADLNQGVSLAFSVPAVSFDPPIDVTVDLDAETTVAPDVPVAGAGIVGARYEADVYRLPGGGGEPRFLRSTEPCDNLPGPVAVVRINDILTETLGLECGAVHLLPDLEFELRVLDPSGGTGEYGFSVGPLGDETVAGVLDTELTLVVEAPGDQVSAVFELEAGDRIYVDVRESIPGGFTLVGPDGVEVAGWRHFLNPDVIEIGQSGRHTMTFEAGGDVGGQSTVFVHTVADDLTFAGELGEELVFALESPGQQISATLDLDEGDRLDVEILESPAGEFHLLDPAGELVVGWRQFLEPDEITIADSGIHTITFIPLAEHVGTARIMVVPVGG